MCHSKDLPGAMKNILMIPFYRGRNQSSGVKQFILGFRTSKWQIGQSSSKAPPHTHCPV